MRERKADKHSLSQCVPIETVGRSSKIEVLPHHPHPVLCDRYSLIQKMKLIIRLCWSKKLTRRGFWVGEVN